MNEIKLPKKIEIDQKSNNKAIVVIEPLYPGYGLTLGNALRRVLISSLPGAAITAIKIKGVQHEFSGLKYVKEDIVELILNIKLIRLKLLRGENAVLNLKAKGEKVVTAKDIKKLSDVEIVNPDQVIATLADKSAELEIEFIVGRGLGYSPVESREKEKSEIGVIAIDAIFTPVLKARFEIENVRVGQMTNYDRLTLEIDTDGTITPTDAFYQAGEILVNHFTLFTSKKTASKKKSEAKQTLKSETNQEEIVKDQERAESKNKKEVKK
ncbi:MAG: DNA-directed RNA polymerase subunit alpha [Candidatus Kerfeldbacteria bacterium CG08_land_8_20_14_0_20_40_16]|uniref:DNA-directed RNA polymerase subunit alpha n=1 Tax=Candidatus Kerfeldbacteria bacterium CG08_land_8_20_14_0_20_40_16 TaxID=2014244 RepID=A0A2H0YUE5_9BACT|nr:MAG: DNA-directed RNA polymerase subunit alpha [Candidatus Kerfeldbacteria bacterium CG08_land_8_20_14_0_20_40_16]